MAAPSIVYNTEKLVYKLDASNIFNNDMALKLSDYGSNIKTLFYLDVLLIPDKGDTNGFIGAVVEGGANASMHATARSGKERLALGSTKYIILNDAGLNTLGIPTINSNLLLWANNIRNNYTFKSAYYVDTDFTGVRYRVGAGAWTEVSFFTTVPQNTSLTANKDFDSGLTKGTLIEMQGILKNAEGDKYSASLNHILLSNIYQYDVIKRTAACLKTGQTVIDIWITEDTLDLLPTIPEDVGAATGVYFYTDIEQTVKVGTGWYYGLQDNKSFFADANGQITHYSTCVETNGDVYLSIEDDGMGMYNPVFASVDPIWTFSDITITGRIDTHPSLATPDGKNFTVVITQGDISGFYDINLPTGVQYYWQNVLVSPSGFILHKQEPI